MKKKIVFLLLVISLVLSMGLSIKLSNQKKLMVKESAVKKSEKIYKIYLTEIVSDIVEVSEELQNENTSKDICAKMEEVQLKTYDLFLNRYLIDLLESVPPLEQSFEVENESSEKYKNIRWEIRESYSLIDKLRVGGEDYQEVKEQIVDLLDKEVEFLGALNDHLMNREWTTERIESTYYKLDIEMRISSQILRDMFTGDYDNPTKKDLIYLRGFAFRVMASHEEKEAYEIYRKLNRCTSLEQLDMKEIRALIKKVVKEEEHEDK